MNTQFLTNDGQQHARSQLEYLRTVKRTEVARYLREAAEAGDVTRNAAFEDARFEQARLEARIAETESEAALHPITGHSRIETAGMREPLYTLWHAEGQVLSRQARSTGAPLMSVERGQERHGPIRRDVCQQSDHQRKRYVRKAEDGVSVWSASMIIFMLQSERCVPTKGNSPPSLHTSKKIPPELDVLCKEEHVKLRRDGALSSPAKARSTECSFAANATSTCDRFGEPEQKGCSKQGCHKCPDDPFFFLFCSRDMAAQDMLTHSQAAFLYEDAP